MQAMKKRIGIPIILASTITLGAVLQHVAEEDMLQSGFTWIKPDPMKYNTYDKGQCTYYVFDKIKADGHQIEKHWRDAKHWASKAKADGYTVNKTPKVGAILQSPRGEQGHVAYVERIEDDGRIHVSEMNYNKPYEVTTRDITPDRIERYAYIHPKVNEVAQEHKA